ncbi:MAG: peptidylprolyl isomerase [Ignavibacteriae bacterium]|nr:peptidylprolyl isomerase [Ignavibacteriota bacterium]
MFKKLILISLSTILVFLVSCSPKHSEIVVAEYGDYEIKMDEFEKAYAKNVGGIEAAKQDSIDEYNKFLELFVNFNMKLRDAKVRGLENDPAILEELDTYKKNIGVSYYLEKELVDKGIKELYDRRRDEIRVSHILIRKDKITDEEAKAKAYEIIGRLRKGAKFEDEVNANSDDQFSKKNSGDIYYITAGSVLPALEEIAYSTQVDSVNPEPLATQYGYHVIKVTDRKKRTPQVRASHILIAKSKTNNDSLNTIALEKAKGILERIKKGEDFGTLAKEFSEDPGSKENGGDLGFFERRQMVQPFDETAFNQEVNQVSDIVETQYGYHIIKTLGKTEYPSFEDEKQNVRNIYEKSKRKDDYQKLLNQFSKEIEIVTNDANLKEIISNSDSTIVNEDYWNSNLHQNFGDKVVTIIDNQSFEFDKIVDYVLQNPKNANAILDGKSIPNFLNGFKEDKIFEIQVAKRLANDENFNSLMQDYKHGIIIFKLQEDEVWNKMKMDSTAIKNLYEQNKDNYTLPDRVQFKELLSKSDSLMEVYKKELQNGANFDSLLIKNKTKGRSENLPYQNELKEVSQNKYAQAAFALSNPGDLTDIIGDEKGKSILQLVKKDPARHKTFDEARPEVTSAYQDIESAQLENDYISRLKTTYKPVLYYDELQKAFKN